MCSAGYGYFQVVSRTIPLCCALLATVACEAPTEPEPPLLRPATIEVTPDFAILPPDGTVQLTAVVRDQNGDKMGDAGVEWSTENAMVALVDETRLAIAKREGRTEIRAKHDTILVTVEIVVSDDPDRYVLTRFYDATDGPNWRNNSDWRSSLPLSDWEGVFTDNLGRVVSLALLSNRLAGELPREIGELSQLRLLDLANNALAGPIPSSIGRLGNLETLYLANNHLTGPVPAQIGEAFSLIRVRLSGNPLQGFLPERLTELSLRLLGYDGTGLCAPRHAAFQLWLETISQVRGQSCSASRHDRLVLTNLYAAMGGSGWTRRDGWLTDAEPGDWAGVSVDDDGRVTALDLKDNNVSRKLPYQLAYLSQLTRLDVSANDKLRGSLHEGMTELDLDTLHFADTRVCAPPLQDIADWLDEMSDWSGDECQGARSILVKMPMVYLTHPVQNRDAGVPLIAGRDALLRVFAVADSVNYFNSKVRVTFYKGRRVVHVANMTVDGRRGIPSKVDESRLETSHHASIPGKALVPGLSMVVEVDPDHKLPLRQGSQRRIPQLGTLALDVRGVPEFKMTIVPIQVAGGDTTLAAGASRMTTRSQAVQETLKMLPINDYDFSVREPFHASAGQSLLQQIDLLRQADGDPGYYVGIIGGGGVAYIGGRANLSDTTTGTMAHEFGHNMSLRHAPCGGAPGPDPDFPYAGGRTGAWGHERESGTLWSPTTPDIMSYCRGTYWISDYHHVKALEYRLYQQEEEEADARSTAARGKTSSLVLWGRTGPGEVILDPAIVLDAIPSLPEGGGRYRIEGRTAGGGPLFALRFDPMIEAESGEEHFVFTLPVDPAWAGSLASITVSGPNGSDLLDATVHRPLAIVTDRVTGRIRKLLRDFEAVPVAGPGEVVTVSYGLPDEAALRWRR